MLAANTVTVTLPFVAFSTSLLKSANSFVNCCVGHIVESLSFIALLERIAGIEVRKNRKIIVKTNELPKNVLFHTASSFLCFYIVISITLVYKSLLFTARKPLCNSRFNILPAGLFWHIFDDNIFFWYLKGNNFVLREKLDIMRNHCLARSGDDKCWPSVSPFLVGKPYYSAFFYFWTCKSTSSTSG